MAEEREEPVVDLESAYSKSEEYIIENKKSIQIIVGVAVAIVAFYFVYKNVIQGPKMAEAQSAIWQAEQAFENDSFKVALEGNNAFMGFMDIADEYSGTPTGNIANYYAGICLLQMGQFEDAIEYLSDYDGSDEMIGPMATGAIGDAYSELENHENALNYYERAATQRDNQYTSPMFLQKAGMMAEITGDYAKAAELYTKIKEQYPDAQQANDVDKYIARAEAAK